MIGFKKNLVIPPENVAPRRLHIRLIFIYMWPFIEQV